MMAVEKLVHIAIDSIEKKKKAYALLVDFEKASDKVDRTLLISKIQHKFWLCDGYIKVLASILDHTKVSTFNNELCFCGHFHNGPAQKNFLCFVYHFHLLTKRLNKTSIDLEQT